MCILSEAYCSEDQGATQASPYKNLDKDPVLIHHHTPLMQRVSGGR